MKEKLVKNMEVPVSLMDFLLQNQEKASWWEFFSLKFHVLRYFLGEYDFRSLFVWFLAD